MILSHRHRFIFVHVFKNAGTSFRRALLPRFRSPGREGVGVVLHLLQKKGILKVRSGSYYRLLARWSVQPMPMHSTALQVANFYGEKVFREYCSVAIVRNPWDWQVSHYHYILKMPQHREHKTVKAFPSFKEYLRWRCRKRVARQLDFVVDEHGDCLVRNFLRFEYLGEDIESLSHYLGWPISLPRLNQSEHLRYDCYYDEESRGWVADRFQEDIKFLGYNFDNSVTPLPPNLSLE